MNKMISLDFAKKKMNENDLETFSVKQYVLLDVVGNLLGKQRTLQFTVHKEQS